MSHENLRFCIESFFLFRMIHNGDQDIDATVIQATFSSCLRQGTADEREEDACFKPRSEFLSAVSGLPYLTFRPPVPYVRPHTVCFLIMFLHSRQHCVRVTRKPSQREDRGAASMRNRQPID
jgi:hypothetical protein